MTASTTVISAFTGRAENVPLAVNVKYKGKKKKIFVLFGSIHIPFKTNVSEEDLKHLEENCGCVVKPTGNGWIVTPKVVSEIIGKDGALCSHCDNHREALEDWMNEHGGVVVKTLLGL